MVNAAKPEKAVQQNVDALMQNVSLSANETVIHNT